MISLWDLRNTLAKKLNISFLAGRHAGLHFTDTKLVLLQGYEITPELVKSGEKTNLIFLHIPKTAGSTVNVVLEAGSILANRIYLKVPVKDYKPAILMEDGWLGALSTANQLSENKLANADVISGHFPYGIHHNRRFSFSYFTIVRDPIEREISSFNYLYQTGGIERDVSFEKFSFSLMDNPQVRMLAGAPYMTGVCDDDVYAAALENLKTKFLLYGPAEKTDEILNTLIGLFQWPSIAHYSCNVTKMKIIKDIDDDLSTRLLERHAYDKMLHDYVRGHWAEWKSLNVLGDKELMSTDEVMLIHRDFGANKKVELILYNKIANAISKGRLSQ